MKVLLVGGGGREHALAWKLKRDDPSVDLVAAPGNPGIATLAECVAVGAGDVGAVADLAEQQRVDLVVIGPEAPLAAGLVDELERRHIRAFGPSRAASQIEASKRFAKGLMLKGGIPTAEAAWYRRADAAKAAVRKYGAPIVIKASGLAAGKGVSVCHTEDDAFSAIDSMLTEHVYGAAGDEILVEEYMEGEELSIFVLTDGENYVSMLPAQDHKRLSEGDVGPNTGGMGAYAPVGAATAEVMDTIHSRIIGPTLGALREHGSPFRGLLYCGLMLTAVGPRVVEFNCRFGDPETQAVLPLMESGLLDLMLRTTEPGGLAGTPDMRFRDGAAVTVVVAAPGYPDAPVTGAELQLPPDSDSTVVFHAGTRRAPDGRLMTAGGRVVSVTSVANSIAEARHAAVNAAEHVRFPGRQFRRDIGWRELIRRAGVA